MLVGISKKRVLANVAGTVGVRFLNILFILWMYQYLLRRVPADEFALYPVLIVVMMLVPVVASLFASALSRSVVAAYATDDRDEVRRLHSSAVLGLAVILVGIAAAGVFGAAHVDRIIDVPQGLADDARLMAIILVIGFCLGVFNVPFATAFEVRQQFIQRDVIALAMEILKIAVTFLLLTFVEARVLYVVVAAVGSQAIGVAIVIVRARQMLPEFRISRRCFDFGVLRRILSFGVWAVLGQVSVLIVQNAGPVVLALFGTPVQVTAYFLGSVVDRRIASTMSMALAPLQPVMTTMSITKDSQRLANTYLRGGRYALWTSLFVICPLVVFANEIIVLYAGEEYRDAALVMTILLVAYPITGASIMLPRVAIATGRIKLYFAGTLLTSTAALTFLIIAVAGFDQGAPVAALAFSACLVTAHLAFFWPLGLSIAGITFRRFIEGTLAPGLAPAAASLSVLIALKMLVQPDSWIEIVACSAGGAAAYVVVLLSSCLKADERAALSQRIGRIIAMLGPTRRSQA